MSIIDENGNAIMRVGMIHKIMAGACVALISAQTVALMSWGVWVTSTVARHDVEIAVIRAMKTTSIIPASGNVAATDCFDK